MNDAIPKHINEVTLLRDDAENELASLGIDANSSDTARRLIFTTNIEMIKSQIRENMQGTGKDLWRNEEGYTFCAYTQHLKSEFANSILISRLNNISTILQVGSEVVVTCSRTRETCKGKIFKMEKGYCLVESIDPAFNDICYENTRNISSSNKTVGMKVNLSNSAKYAIIKEVTPPNSCIALDFKEIAHSHIKADVSWLSELILKNKGRHLQVFLNADVFNNIIADFLTEDWLPQCQLLLDAIYAIFV
eukprot:gene491-921_t